MRSAIIAAMGAASLAAAQFTNSTGPVAPQTAGDFKFFGCVSSPSGFPGFQRVAMSDSMTIDVCAASCPTKYMAVSGKICMCGNDITASELMPLDKSKCSSPCPGNKAQACGAPIFLTRRQAVGPGSAVSLYERQDGVNPLTTVSITSTVTSTVVETITACPSTDINCPIGSVTTKMSIQPTPVCEETEEWVEWHKKKIVCYSGLCGSGVSHKEGDPKHRVVCQDDHCQTEVCDNEEWNKLVVCKGGHCKYADCEGSEEECKHKKVVCWNGKCTVEKCFESECEKKLVCKGDKCKHEVCEGDDCNKKIICDPNGQDCHIAPPPAGPPTPPGPPAPCHGEGCRVPPSPPCHGEHCKFVQPPTPVGPPGPPGPCEGENCPPGPPGPCEGKNCPPGPPGPCEGENCPPGPPGPCEGENCPPGPPGPCEGENCPPGPPAPCQGENCPPGPPGPCEGENCPPGPPAPCQGENCIQPPPVAPSGIMPKPLPSGPPVVAGAGSIAVNIIGAAAGLLFVL
ncbi:hypothetical protein E4U55_000970 [Claviceps digitariae]|nr:hypothetical protein E4U55_000970 [Claviceps digitariae]